MARCRVTLSVNNIGGAVAPGVDVEIPEDAMAFTIRAVDAAGVAVAWTAALKAFQSQEFHFAAGEAWSEENLKLDDDLELTVVTPAGATVEVLIWSVD